MGKRALKMECDVVREIANLMNQQSDLGLQKLLAL